MPHGTLVEESDKKEKEKEILNRKRNPLTTTVARATEKTHQVWGSWAVRGVLSKEVTFEQMKFKETLGTRGLKQAQNLANPWN